MSRRVAAVGVAAVVVLVALPFALPAGRTVEAATVGVYVIVLAGYALALGHGGQISLGQGAFMAVGAYTAAILMAQHGIRDLATIPAAAAVAGACGLVVALITSRFGRVGVAVATFALAVALPPTLVRFNGVTGGATGISLFGTSELTGHGRGVTILGVRLAADSWGYALTWTIASLLYLLAFAIARSRFGRALRAARDSERGALAAGVLRDREQTIALCVSAAYAGVGGALLAIVDAYASPANFPLVLSLYVTAGAAIAGLGSLRLVIPAAVLVQLLPDVVGLLPHVRARQEGAPAFVLGALLVAVLLVVPLVARLRASFEVRRR